MQPDDAAAMEARPLRPARLWYWVAGTAAVAGVVWLAVDLFLGIGWSNELIEGFQRVPIPGQAEVSFAEPGGYVLYFEGAGASDTRTTIPAYNVSLTSVASGQEVSIRPYRSSQIYDHAGHSGRAVGTFRIEEPGRFLLRTEGAPQGGANVAVGPAFHNVAPAVAGAFILVLGGMVLTMVVAIRRRQARHPLAAPAAQPAATWGPGTVAAGWFADPDRRHELRYWDGQRWTEHVSDRGAPGVDPL